MTFNRKEYIKEYYRKNREKYNQKQRERRLNPEVKEKEFQRMKEYNSRLEIKERKRKYAIEYRARPGIKEMIAQKKKEYRSRADVKMADRQVRIKFDMKKKYGIEYEEYERMLISQEYKCAICRVYFNKFSRRPHIDHSHNTGTIRGLLCTNCNTGIGLLQDDVIILNRAADYLSK